MKGRGSLWVADRVLKGSSKDLLARGWRENGRGEEGGLGATAEKTCPRRVDKIFTYERARVRARRRKGAGWRTDLI